MTSDPQRNGWNYIDVMTAALTLLEPSKLHADDERWNQAWERIVSNPEARQLLPDVHFPNRSPYQSISDEVEALRRVLLWSSVLSLGNPRYQYFTMSPDAVYNLRERYDPLISEHRDVLEKMAQVLREKLVVEKVASPTA